MSLNILVGYAYVSDAWKERLQAIAPEAEFTYVRERELTPELLSKADVLFTWLKPSKLVHCRNLKLLQLYSSGADGYQDRLPPSAVLCSSTGAYGRAIAQFALAHTLAALQKLHLYRDAQREGGWQRFGPPRYLEECTVLVVGLGDLGSSYAKLVKPFGGQVIGVRRTPRPTPQYLDGLYTMEELDNLLPRADVVALCLPANSGTRGLMDAGRLARFREGAVLINLGRGNAVDMDALETALRAGRPGTALLDVTDPEPLPSDHPLWRNPNAVITPHVAGYYHTPATADCILEIFAHNLAALLGMGEYRNRVDPDVGYVTRP